MKNLDKRQYRALDFIVRVAIEHNGNLENAWHSFDKDVSQAIRSLEHRGLVEVNAFEQFRATMNGLRVYAETTPNR